MSYHRLISGLLAETVLTQWERKFLHSVYMICLKKELSEKQKAVVDNIDSNRTDKDQCEDAPCCGCCGC